MSAAMPITCEQFERRLIEGLMCGRLNAVVCDYQAGRVTLHMPEGACCDMCGAIAYATRHFPAVRIIQTIAGDKPDTAYVRRGNTWSAQQLPTTTTTTTQED